MLSTLPQDYNTARRSPIWARGEEKGRGGRFGGKKLDNCRLFEDNKGSMLKLLFFLAVMMLAPLPCIAAIYSYLDNQGVVHWTNQRPAGKGYQVLFDDRGGDGPVSAGLLDKNTYDRLIKRHSEANGLDYRLVKAVMIAESNGNPKAVSQKGAQGLMQIMPDTAPSWSSATRLTRRRTSRQERGISSCCTSFSRGISSLFWPHTMPGRKRSYRTWPSLP